MSDMSVKTDFVIGQVVYMRGDEDNRVWIVLAFVIFEDHIEYVLCSGGDEMTANRLEISAERQITGVNYN